MYAPAASRRIRSTFDTGITAGVGRLLGGEVLCRCHRLDENCYRPVEGIVEPITMVNMSIEWVIYTHDGHIGCSQDSIDQKPTNCS
jgi:hypothetical protein